MIDSLKRPPGKIDRRFEESAQGATPAEMPGSIDVIDGDQRWAHSVAALNQRFASRLWR
ncbi:MAG: hypothetical protein ACREPZ_11845 [Rhodanobacteraceae bacterium]